MADPIKAAGVLFLTPEGKVLTLRRVDEGHYWALPGGQVEEGESEEEAARREVEEETGRAYAGPLKPLTRRVKDGVDFTTFLAPDAFEFEPRLNHEHDLARWATIEEVTATGGTHPGLGVVLARLGMDELQVAQAIRDGELVSPQRFYNMLLVALRVTGTGAAYRYKEDDQGKVLLDEYVWRDPSLYLNQEFLERCQGLTVVLEHPASKDLTPNEFKDRVVGSITLPYIQGDEVWGIAKIYDEVTAKLLETEPLSTSPGVVFRKHAEGFRRPTADGKEILIEGKPALLDHLAICVQGVWDKGGSPAGVSNPATGEVTMADEKVEKKDEGMPTDPEKGTPADKILAHLDGLHKKFDDGLGALHARMDAFEEKYGEKKDDTGKIGDPPAEGEAPTAATDDTKKDDAVEEPEKKADDDTTKKDDDMTHKDDSVTKRLADLEKRLPVELSPEDRKRFVAAQVKADPVFHAFGDDAPRWLAGESLMDYRKRMIRIHQPHSPTWKGANIETLTDEATLQNVEDVVFADAISAAKRPSADGEPTLRMITERDDAGRNIRRFYGSPEACWGQFRYPAKQLAGISKTSGLA